MRLHLGDLRRAEADVAVRLGGEEAGEHLLQRGAGEVLHLVPLPLGRVADDGGQGEHAESHVPGLVLEDAPADLGEERVHRALLHHAEHGYREGLRHQLERDGLDVPARVREDGVEDEALVLRHGVVEPAQPVLDVALEDLVVPGLVHDLGGLEELGVGAGHRVHELAAREQRALLAEDEDARGARR